MTIFWVIAGLLIAGALLFVLPPLLRGVKVNGGVERREVNVSIYQDQLAELEADVRGGVLTAEQYEQGKSELQRRLLEDVSTTENAAPATVIAHKGRAAAAVVGIAMPLCAVLLYWQLGSREALAPPRTDVSAAVGENPTLGQIQEMVTGLVEKLRQNPNDAEGWVMLGRSYTVMGRYGDAATAYARATELVPDDAQLWADYADIAAMAGGKRFKGKPAELINKALQVDPTNQKALALAGSAAMEEKNYGQAAAYWEKLLHLLPESSPASQSVANGVARAREMAAAQQGQAGAAGGAAVSGTVTLSPALAGKASPTDSLFVFARAASGPKMPLAIVRAQVKDLPLKFALNDSMSMMPERKMSNFSEVIVAAKISKSGSATPQSGDLQGSSGAVKVGSNGVQVVIDSIAP